MAFTVPLSVAEFEVTFVAVLVVRVGEVVRKTTVNVPLDVKV